jgi:hypothetical protein
LNLWAVMTREEGFDPKHVSVKPQAKQSIPATRCCSTAPLRRLRGLSAAACHDRQVQQDRL